MLSERPQLDQAAGLKMGVNGFRFIGLAGLLWVVKNFSGLPADFVSVVKAEKRPLRHATGPANLTTPPPTLSQSVKTIRPHVLTRDVLIGWPYRLPSLISQSASRFCCPSPQGQFPSSFDWVGRSVGRQIGTCS
ncbi:unnamed protein product [Protopolystoma xenopodis]|uniref:Uncharacterized protein n=1 Tax=Protopolystoma xenopodis TaxID=117903 RepID=A0A448WDQ9_9PLAT|nr:unnamed protein product [Protopolystoma xenopodis]